MGDIYALLVFYVLTMKRQRMWLQGSSFLPFTLKTVLLQPNRSLFAFCQTDFGFLLSCGLLPSMLRLLELACCLPALFPA